MIQKLFLNKNLLNCYIKLLNYKKSIKKLEIIIPIQLCRGAWK